MKETLRLNGRNRRGETELFFLLVPFDPASDQKFFQQEIAKKKKDRQH